MRFIKHYLRLFALVLAGCATQAPEITEPLKPQAKLVEGVSCIVPDAPTAPSMTTLLLMIAMVKTAQHRQITLLAINHSPLFVIIK